MAAVVAFRGLDKVIKYFIDSQRPIWKVTLANDGRQVVGYGYNQKEIEKASHDLRDLLSNIEPDNVYSLETWGRNDKGPYTRADSVINFALTDPPVSALGNKSEVPMYDKAGLTREMVLINEKASLQSELGILKFQYSEAEKLILELKSTIADLERDLDEYEAEAEEESVSGTGEKTDYNAVFAGLIKEKGGALVDLFLEGKKKDALKDDVDIKISGMNDSDVWKKHSIETYCQVLLKEDPNLQYHLYRLVRIAQEKPAMFKELLSMLEKV